MLSSLFSQKQSQEKQDNLVENYLSYLFFEPVTDEDPAFKKGKDEVSKIQNYTKTITKQLCTAEFKEKLRVFAKSNQAEDEETHKRVKRLYELLTDFSANEKQALLVALEDYGIYLTLATLNSQIVSYEHDQESTSGAVRMIGSLAGVSQSKNKSIFLKMIANFISAKYLNIGISSTFPTERNATWISLLQDTLLAGRRTQAALELIPSTLLQEIGITPALLSNCKTNAAAMTEETNALFTSIKTKIVLTLTGDLTLVRIKGKTDGKNTGYYDGVYVTQEAYQRQLEGNQTNLTYYQPGEVYFLKGFPSDQKIVEGFTEAFVGNLIRGCIDKGLINKEQQNYFAPASIIELPNKAGPALLQSFTLGAKALYQVINPERTQKPSGEEFLSLMRGKGYQQYFTSGNPDLSGLAFIIMLMLIVANYSLHSGNILVTTDKDGINRFTAIDYGAALRNLLATANQKNIWTPLETMFGLINSSGNGALRVDKNYIAHYLVIPSFEKLIIDHAKQFLQTSDNFLDTFKSVICSAISNTYDSYKMAIVHQYGRNAWNGKAKKDLFDYIFCSKDRYDNFQEQLNKMQPESNWENNERILFAKSICDVIIVRLEKLASLEPKNQMTVSVKNSNSYFRSPANDINAHDLSINTSKNSV